MSGPKVISFFNNKGGVGKSTLTANLASVFADDNNVLVIDNDPQGNVSELLGQEQSAEIKKAYLGKDFKIIQIDFNPVLEELGRKKRTSKQISLITGGMALLEAEPIIKDKPARETILARNIEDTVKKYDYVFIDNPPSVSTFVWNALYASDFVIIPFKPGRSEFSGIKNLLGIIDTLKKDLKHDIKNLGILFNMCTGTSVSEMYIKSVQEQHDEKMVFDNGFKAAVDFMKAAPFGLPVDLLFPEKSEVVEMVMAVKEEVIKKLEGKKWI
jgi:chromosome partitioning protein